MRYMEEGWDFPTEATLGHTYKSKETLSLARICKIFYQSVNL